MIARPSVANRTRRLYLLQVPRTVKKMSRTRTMYVRVNLDDLEEMKRRRAVTGATVAAQIRILVHEALKGKIVK